MGVALTSPPPRPAPESDDATADGRAMARLADGDLSALGGLYDRHHAAVRRFLHSFTSGSPDVEDLVQETFLLAARKAPSFKTELPVRAWLLGLSAQLARRRRRTVARFFKMLERFAQRFTDGEAAPGRSSTVDADMDALERAMAELSDNKRAVVLLVEVEGRSCAEAAAALEIPIGTVWTRLHHARKELRAALTKEVPE